MRKSSGEAATEAQPRKLPGVADLPERPEVVAAAIERGVSDVVHFTTLQGAVGVLAARAVKSRRRLRKSQHLEFVYQPNSPIRKDEPWLDYVNLSIQRINDWMFGASTRWHPREENPWVVLSFAPEILSHPGVVFATTNNIYPACRRAEGLAGFRRMFAEEVVGRYGRLHGREGKQAAWTTDRQAEVLYPGELSCDYLQRIDVQTAASVDSVHGVLGGLRREGLAVRHAPEVFE